RAAVPRDQSHEPKPGGSGSKPTSRARLGVADPPAFRRCALCRPVSTPRGLWPSPFARPSRSRDRGRDRGPPGLFPAVDWRNVMLNKVQLIGFTGADAEIRTVSGGKKVATLRVATNRYTKKDGDRKDYTTWHQVEIWNQGTVGWLEGRHLPKGSK